MNYLITYCQRCLQNSPGYARSIKSSSSKSETTWNFSEVIEEYKYECFHGGWRKHPEVLFRSNSGQSADKSSCSSDQHKTLPLAGNSVISRLDECILNSFQLFQSVGKMSRMKSNKSSWPRTNWWPCSSSCSEVWHALWSQPSGAKRSPETLLKLLCQYMSQGKEIESK